MRFSGNNINFSLGTLFAGLIVICASLLYLQYPISSTFPIGGDATRYILDYLEVRDALKEEHISIAVQTFFTNTQYPLSQALVAVSSVIPVSWPIKFIWLITIGNFLVGLIISFLLYRLSGYLPALFGFFIWSLTVTQITDHLQDGTLAQLWSLIPFLLFLYFLYTKSGIGTLISLLTTFFFHPLSGIVGVLLHSLIIPSAWILRRFLDENEYTYVRKNLYILPFAILGIGILIFIYAPWIVSVDFENKGFSFMNLVASPVGFSFLLVPLGLIAVHKRNTSILPYIVLVSFVFISILLSMNDLFGIGILPYRFKSYLVLASTICGAAGLAELITLLFPKKSQLFIAALLLVSLTASAWHENQPIYAFYESPSKYARLHPDEQEAIVWLSMNSSEDDLVISTRANRHSEWIPIIGNVRWQAYTTDRSPWNLSESEFISFLQKNGVEYIMLFKHRESVRDVLGDKAYTFTTVFENKGSVIYEIEL